MSSSWSASPASAPRCAPGIAEKSPEGLTPAEQLARIAEAVSVLVADQQAQWRDLRAALAEAGIVLVDGPDVTKAEKAWLEDYFLAHVFPLLTPLAIDPAHPFPFIPNLGFTIALQLARVQGRQGDERADPHAVRIDRFIRLPQGADGAPVRLISIEGATSLFIGKLFPGYAVKGVGAFRVIRDSELEILEEAEDLVRLFETALKRRRRGIVIRLDIEAPMPEELQTFVQRALGATDESVFKVDGVLALNEMSQLRPSTGPTSNSCPTRRAIPSACATMAAIASPPSGRRTSSSIILTNPSTWWCISCSRPRAIPTSSPSSRRCTAPRPIRRSSARSPKAAEAGKSVTAVVELKARFDEEANIRWARDLERAGVQVVYGFIELKTHAKLSLVVRREGAALASYVHVGTGNYHPVTARIYTDLSYFTVRSRHRPRCRAYLQLHHRLCGAGRPRDAWRYRRSPCASASPRTSTRKSPTPRPAAPPPSG